MIIDEDTRIVILEGLAGPGLGMQSVYMEIPRKHGNDSDFKMLCNPEVLFTSRLYPTYGYVRTCVYWDILGIRVLGVRGGEGREEGDEMRWDREKDGDWGE